MPTATATQPLSHLTTWKDVDQSTWNAHLDGAVQYYRNGKTWTERARGRSIGLLFFNSSLRTRTSMELAAAQLGAHATTLDIGKGTWGFAWEKGMVMDKSEAEHITEVAGVLSRYYDALGIRAFASLTDYERDRDEVLLNAVVEAASVPVVNMESAFFHPCQALADAATLMTHFDGKPQGRRFVLSWTYHPKALPMAVPNSVLLMAARLGMAVTLAHPPEFGLDDSIVSKAEEFASASGGQVATSNDMDAACEDAQVIYAKSWASSEIYKSPEHEAQLRESYRDWRVTPTRAKEAAFMHCLPVRRNVVVDDAVIDGPSALHLLQAEYRLHAQKAILDHLWNGAS